MNYSKYVRAAISKRDHFSVRARWCVQEKCFRPIRFEPKTVKKHTKAGFESELKQAALREIEKTLEAMPNALRRKIQHIPVVLERRPNSKLREEGVDDDTLGLFIGEAFPDSASGSQELPAQIILYLDNLWDGTDRNPQLFRQEVRRTLLHEFGHYLGLDEDDLVERDLD